MKEQLGMLSSLGEKAIIKDLKAQIVETNLIPLITEGLVGNDEIKVFLVKGLMWLAQDGTLIHFWWFMGMANPSQSRLKLP
jgi:hypothetical protein